VTAQLVPTVRTLVTVPGVYAALRGAWLAQMGAYPARGSLLCLLAQWALETGRGAAMYCYNLGNVRHVPGDVRDWCLLPRVSEIVGGKEVFYDHATSPSMCEFRAFSSLDEGAADYLATVRTDFASTWGALMTGDPRTWVKALAAARYFTASEPRYEDAVASLVAEFDRAIPPDAEQPVAIDVARIAVDPHDDTPPDGDA
jgi:hypothetical protein